MKSMHNIKGIVFDKDGTLIDFEKSWYPLLKAFVLKLTNNDIDKTREVFKISGANLDTKEFVSGGVLGAGSNREIATAWATYLNISDVDSLEQELSTFSKEQIGLSASPITCLKTLFTDLKNMGITSGIATMDGKDSLESCVENLDIYDVCAYRVGYDSGYGIKPTSGMVDGFCKEMSIDPSDVLVVGDNTHDIYMGKNAGARYTVGVLTGNSQEKDLHEADFIIPSVKNLVNLIKQHQQH